ncbi:MAG TPA: VOC family protein [Aquihabitans sp.]|jgi:lactoylglutathione lyase|nr:VOC family protein [Aquihabitans sp.]
MRTLHLGLRVADLDRSLAFYAAVGYEVVGRVPGTPLGDLTMLKLPGDDFVTIELVHRQTSADDGRQHGDGDGGTTLSHLVIQVESIDEAVAALAARGIDVEGHGPADDPADPRTAWIVDPDGSRIELVQWPAGHGDGMTAADFTA